MNLPFISITIKSTVPIVTSNLGGLAFTIQKSYQETIPVIEKSSRTLTFLDLFLAIFLLITTLLFLRYLINIYRLLRKIQKNKKVPYRDATLVLLEEGTLPYSFLKYIFVNKLDFETNKIESELLLHEITHCNQFHTADILLIEFINIFYWFNPIIWLYKKAIYLNHEYSADNKVLEESSSLTYQNILLKIILQSNYSHLVSNFNGSLIKYRLYMMTKGKSSKKVVFGKISAILLFLVLSLSLVISQETTTAVTQDSKEFWYTPILKFHNIILNDYPYNSVFSVGIGTPFASKAFCIGKNDSIIIKKEGESQSFKIKNPILILGKDAGYELLYAKSAILDLKNGQVAFEKGTIETFLYGEEWLEDPKYANDIKLGKKITFEKFDLNLKTNQRDFKTVNGTMTFK